MLFRSIMLTLWASTSAMKTAGIGVALQDAEQVMGEFDNTIHDTQELNSVLAGPLAGAEEDLELDEELAWLEETPLPDPGAAFVPDRPAPRGLGEQPEGRDAEPGHGLPLPSLGGAGADQGGRMAEEGAWACQCPKLPVPYSMIKSGPLVLCFAIAANRNAQAVLIRTRASAAREVKSIHVLLVETQ